MQPQHLSEGICHDPLAEICEECSVQLGGYRPGIRHHGKLVAIKAFMIGRMDMMERILMETAPEIEAFTPF